MPDRVCTVNPGTPVGAEPDSDKRSPRQSRRSSLLPSSLVVAVLIFFALAAVYVLGYGPDFPANLFAPTYDGWKVGGLDTCPEPDFDPAVGQPVTWDCEASLATWLRAAREGFDRRDPTHGSVANVTLHFTATSTKNLANCCEIAVFELTDGSVRAIGVAHLGVDYSRVTSIDYGPDK
jgi:hypothetical protein